MNFQNYILNPLLHNCHIFFTVDWPTEINLHFSMCHFAEQGINQQGALRSSWPCHIPAIDDSSNSTLGSLTLHVLHLWDIHWRGFPRGHFHTQINIGAFSCIRLEKSHPDGEHSSFPAEWAKVFLLNCPLTFSLISSEAESMLGFCLFVCLPSNIESASDQRTGKNVNADPILGF